MDACHLPLHVFLSYSRREESAVCAVRQLLEKTNLPLWIDTESLVPGTPNWESAIRGAIRSAFCVVLLCSPDARESPFVQAELALAQHYKIPIIPVWINGTSWIESTPLSLSQTQYIDLRTNLVPSVLDLLQTRISSIITRRMPKHAVIDDCFAGWYDHSLPYHAYGFPTYISIVLDQRPSRSRTPPDKQRKEQMAVFDPNAYLTTQSILDDLFMSYISNRVEPLEYGKEWVLKGRSGKKAHGINPDRIVAPWSHLEFGWSRRTAEYDVSWAMEAPSQYDLVAGSVWEIKWSKNNDMGLYDQPLGLAVNSDDLYEAVLYGDGKQPILLEAAGYLEGAEFQDVDSKRYRHSIVIENNFGKRRKIIRETAKQFNKNSYSPFAEARYR
jgi:hypothetical protein